MGQFLNPGNEGFSEAINSEIYVDKTGLLEYTNRVCSTKQKLVCNSRPRRFGKSITAEMLTAYYSKGCDSRELFSQFQIGKSDKFDRFLNQCNVIHLDIQWFLTAVGGAGGLFKGSEPSKFIQLAFLTGILPIKKLQTQSALNDFDEFTMLYPGLLTPYIGFTSEEVRGLCEQYHRDYDKVQERYDGYLLNGYQIYNPRAVVGIMLTGEYRSYWSSTGTYESIVPYINMNFDGLKGAILEMLSGSEVSVNVSTFQNDLTSFRDRDDVLTLLIHMGYLAFRQETQTAYIPNEEIRLEMLNAVRVSKWNAYQDFQKKSMDLLNAVLDREEEEVARRIGEIHDEYASSIQYNDENSLSSVLTIAFLGTLQYYFRPIRELPSGRGFADFVYIPKPEYRQDYPALVVELKWNQSADTALHQIREKHDPESLHQYTGKILLAGIAYDKRVKQHSCQIQEYES